MSLRLGAAGALLTNFKWSQLSLLQYWWASRESNTAPTDYESAALTRHELEALCYFFTVLLILLGLVLPGVEFLFEVVYGICEVTNKHGIVLVTRFAQHSNGLFIVFDRAIRISNTKLLKKDLGTGCCYTTRCFILCTQPTKQVENRR